MIFEDVFEVKVEGCHRLRDKSVCQVIRKSHRQLNTDHPEWGETQHGFRRYHWRGRHRCHLVLLSQSRSRHGRVRRVHRQEGRRDPCDARFINDTSEEPFCPCRWVWHTCKRHGCSPTRQSYLNFVSICAAAISPTFASRCGWMRCLQCSSTGKAWSPVRRPDKRSIVTAVPQFHFCSTREFAIKCSLCCVSARPHTHPGPHSVRRQQR